MGGIARGASTSFTDFNPTNSNASVTSIDDSSSTKALASYERVTINDDIVKLQACDANTNCVSSNYREPPNRYVSPFKIVRDPNAAVQRAVRDLQHSSDDTSGFSVADIMLNAEYIHLTVPGTARWMTLTLCLAMMLSM